MGDGRVETAQGGYGGGVTRVRSGAEWTGPTEGGAEPLDPVSGRLPTRPAVLRVTTVLVVEDDESVRGIAVRVLASAGYQVLCASDGVEGLKLAVQHADEIDAIVVDVVMPRMGGVAFAHALAEARVTVPMLFITGYGDRAIPAEGLPAGAHLLEKPFDARTLRRAVDELLLEARVTRG